MKLVITLLVLAPVYGFTMTTTYQTLTPHEGQSDFRLGVGYRSVNAETKSGGKTDATGPSIPVTYYYGLTENHSLGGEISYSSLNQDYKDSTTSLNAKSYGMEDVFFGYKGNFEVGTPTLFIRGGLKIPPEKSRRNWDNNESNTSTGQMAFIGSLGMTSAFSTFNVGFLGLYSANQNGDGEVTSSGKTYSGKITGGSSYQFSAYGEIQNIYHPNVSLDYARSFTSTFTSDSGMVGTTLTGNELIRGTFSLRYEMTPGFEIVPVLAYTTILKKDDFSKYNYFLTGVEARLVF
ncbi:hypothetical protein [Bdellovibrio svalbardensis]|uniref:Transporter n=1 Tax=Bdellovibrio svalbardensis TaxID=2972972 RepID=A0ABT6DHN8_9BACT|nr:hypothetical protein [Bdellovibrio svalbardensis]MDG0816371.1 hypothetical protein [Bdellovibrio svalbardensis]